MECKKYHETTPSSGKNHLVEKVRKSNLNCDSPFRLLPNISTPPSRMFKIRNPFESPLLERLHLPVCSPGLFAESTTKKEDKFLWTICDISHLKPAEIDTACFQENICSAIDPQTESKIQDRISNFFLMNAIVPSPTPQVQNKKKYECPLPKDSNQEKKESLEIDNKNEEPHIISGNDIAMDISNISNDEAQYLPEEEYYKKLFDFESQTPNSSPGKSPLDSPVQFSPLKELEAKSFSDEIDTKGFNICGLSPITPENETSHRDNSKNQSTKESKSVCRLIFSEENSINENDSNGTVGMDKCKETVPENTIIESGLISSDNSGIMSIDEVDKDSEYYDMDISLIHTPKTGLFTSQRKRLSDSFKDLHSSFSQLEDIKEDRSNNVAIKSGLLSEGSSDLGYCSTNVATAPSVIEKTWNNSLVFSSTPTKRKK